MSTSLVGQYVGPYKLEKTLGKGQTGLVKLGIHCVTGMKVAIKIINREKLSENVVNKVEREIAIMKLIEHPHILGLYDVYENRKYLYLILELVSGGELFDYLVKKGRLIPKEAREFFRQIICAVDFCHSHNVWFLRLVLQTPAKNGEHKHIKLGPNHAVVQVSILNSDTVADRHRDLKPENLLLDERNNIKVADFGMASLQPDGLLLETSCGSPHYACPEVIKGDKYDGRTADVWSCGVILYALLVGALPFDDDNLRQLLEKVKRGVFNIPCLVPPDAQHLLRGMINLNPAKRLTLKQVLKHPWMRPSINEGSTHIPQPPRSILHCNPVANESSVDPDVLSSMSSLGCFSDKDILISNLLKEEQNTEKVVYYMLLRRKMRYPSFDDDACSLPCKHPDAPRKRVDSASSLDLTRSGYFNGIDDTKRKLSTESLNMTDRSSPLISRRRAIDKHQRSRSLTGDASPRRLFSTACDTKASNHTMANQAMEQANSIQNDPPIPWKQRLSNLKNSVMGSPRFHRRKMQAPSSEEVAKASDSSNEISKRSWFGSFIANHLLPAEHCEDFANSIFFSGRTLRSLKVELGHAFLSLPSLSYEMVTPTRFQCDYRSAGSSSTSMFSYRTIKFQVDIVCKGTDIKPTHNAETVSDYIIMFTHISGSTRRFKRILELLQHYLTSYTAGQTNKNGRNIHC